MEARSRRKHLIDKHINKTKLLSFASSIKNNSENESFYPLEVYFCETCFHVQLGYLVSPKIMFENYVYVSNTSDSLKKHFSELVQDVLTKISKKDEFLVVDIGSNDGTLLKQFKENGCKVLGVEPAKNIANIAKSNGIDTWNDFFNKESAKEIRKIKGPAKIVSGTNVFAHQPEYDSFMNGVLELLDEDGIFVIEVPYLVNLIKSLEFDTIYHEHVSYFSVRPLEKLLNKFGLEIFSIDEKTIHGGTIRVMSRRGRNSLPKENKFLQIEREMGLDKIETFYEFAKKVQDVKKQLVCLLKDLRNSGKRIAGYGAAAKGNTLLSYCEIDKNMIEYIIDKNPLKQGLLTPGTHIPVLSTEIIKENPPEYLVILAWNFAEEIMEQQSEFKRNGGKFIVPLPVPKII